MSVIVGGGGGAEGAVLSSGPKLLAVLSLAAICATVVPAARSTGVACGWESKPPQRWHHVVWIWMENESFDQVVGTASARYLTTLSRECGVATDYSAVSHPSLPNYIAATSGPCCSSPSTRARQARTASRRSW